MVQRPYILVSTEVLQVLATAQYNEMRRNGYPADMVEKYRLFVEELTIRGAI
jgi:hypothetical protein